MKKLLLSCFLALGIGANAQFSYTGDFEGGYSTTIYKQFGGGTRTAAAACNGSNGGQLGISTTITNTGFMIDLATISQTGNGQKIDVTANYKKATGAVGTISLAYFTLDPVSNLWTVTPFGTSVALTSAAITTCASLSASIPSGVIHPSKTQGIGVWFVRSSGSGNVFVDDIVINQEVVATVPSSCANVTTPVAGSTIDAGSVAITWGAVATAVDYKLTIGTTSGGTDVLNTVVVGTTTNVSLAKNTTYYIKVVPSNTNGDAVGCTEFTVTTNNTIAYCGPLTTNQPAAVYPISSVSFTGVTNPSSATAGAVSPHEYFTSTKFEVNPGASYPLAVTGTGLGTNRFGMTVWIDWNADGDFNDANEQYFTLPANFKGGTGATINLTGDIVVPGDAVIGETRMRIKYNFSSSTTSLHEALKTACTQMGNGQAEDYTIEVKAVTAAPNCTTFTVPTDGATNVAANVNLAWNAAAGATGYKLYIGTTSGGTDVANGTDVSVNSYSITLAANTLHYAKVVPYNAIGDAIGCTEISFTTGGLVYCLAAATILNNSYERITNVKVADIDNPSTALATSGYEDFTSIIGTVNRKGNYPIVIDIVNFDDDITAVWIDYNQDGVFGNDEKTDMTVNDEITTGTITIPESAKLGKTRMRVRTNYASAPPACGDTSFGQVEDYTLDIKAELAVNNDVTKSNISVYPNPFADVLKISDVKDVKSISVSDMSGRQVKTLKPSAELNLSSLKSGVYVVTLNMNDGSVKTFKTIKR